MRAAHGYGCFVHAPRVPCITRLCAGASAVAAPRHSYEADPCGGETPDWRLVTPRPLRRLAPDACGTQSQMASRLCCTRAIAAAYLKLGPPIHCRYQLWLHQEMRKRKCNLKCNRLTWHMLQPFA